MIRVQTALNAGRAMIECCAAKMPNSSRLATPYAKNNHRFIAVPPTNSRTRIGSHRTTSHRTSRCTGQLSAAGGNRKGLLVVNRRPPRENGKKPRLIGFLALLAGRFARRVGGTELAPGRQN